MIGRLTLNRIHNCGANITMDTNPAYGTATTYHQNEYVYYNPAYATTSTSTTLASSLC